MTLAIPDLVDRLLAWYDRHGRQLPWRENPDPYGIWVSEIMLQQTQVATVIPYYERFMADLPRVEDLAAVDQDRLNKLWQGLGYYSRARHLKAAAEIMVRETAGELPERAADLVKLPGIGPYTAGAVASIAFGERTPAVDGNVMRILSRLTADETPVNTSKSRAHYTPLVDRLVPAHRPGDFNQALMDLGATICIPKTPRCPSCPWQDGCLAYTQDRTQDLPRREKKAKRKIHNYTVLLLRYNKKVYVRRRPTKGLLAGLWEFPRLEGHLSAQAVQAQLADLGFAPDEPTYLGASTHLFTHLEWRMEAFMVTCHQAPCLSEGQWVSRAVLNQDLSLPSAFAPWLAHVNQDTAF